MPEGFASSARTVRVSGPASCGARPWRRRSVSGTESSQRDGIPVSLLDARAQDGRQEWSGLGARPPGRLGTLSRLRARPVSGGEIPCPAARFGARQVWLADLLPLRWPLGPPRPACGTSCAGWILPLGGSKSAWARGVSLRPPLVPPSSSGGRPRVLSAPGEVGWAVMGQGSGKAGEADFVLYSLTRHWHRHPPRCPSQKPGHHSCLLPPILNPSQSCLGYVHFPTPIPLPCLVQATISLSSGRPQ